ncbi:hypothetical protein LJK88_10265 [Paenibacillus sp. P26]|nr:hypothetical protein LJK88_10265 [Paenibacillus sp. P26]
MLKQFADNQLVYHPMYAALAFARYGDQKQIYALVKKKLERQREAVRILKEVYYEHIPTVSRSVLHMMKSRWEHGETELLFLERLAADAEAGRLTERGMPIED